MAVLEKLYSSEVEAIRSGRSFLDLARENPNTEFELTRQWLQASLETGAQALPLSLKPPRQFWQRNLAITKEYILGDDITLTDVGMVYGINRERIRQIIANTVGKLWSNSPEEVQKLLPLNQMRLAKPRSLQYRQDQSLRLGGRSFIVARLLAKGSSLEKLKQAAGGSHNLGRVRVVLEGWGLEIPRSKRNLYTLYQPLESPAAGYKLPQSLTNEIDRSVYETDLRRSRKTGNRILISLRGLTRECGLHWEYADTRVTDIISRVISEAGIDVMKIFEEVKSGPQEGTRMRFVIPSAFADQAKQVLRSDPRLEPYRKNPIEKIYGPQSEHMPTTTDLVSWKEYGGLSSLLGQIGRKRVYKKLLGNMFDDQCPVPIYGYRNAVFYPLSQEELLRAYLLKRLPRN